METYILKSAVCLAIFFVFYKVFLENASFHKFKRGYLLGSLAVSFLIPFITFTNYVEAPTTSFVPVVENTVQYVPTTIPVAATIAETPFNYINLLWWLYGAGVLFFAFRFAKNILTLHSNIKNNEKIKHGSFVHVLLKEFVAPHTFFSNIFFHKKTYDAGEIPQEVVWHEETHAAQKHSFDIVLIELLQVAFWFNPILYVFKKSIKLNHEFLADSAVIQRQQDAASYQKILLDYTNAATSPNMANAINYASIKKRFTVMKTHTSKKATLVKVLLVLPLLAILIYGFSTTQEVIKTEPSTNELSKNEQSLKDNTYKNEEKRLTARSISIKIIDDNFWEVEDVKIPKKDLYSRLGSLNADITKKQRDRIINIHVSANSDIAYEDLLFIQKVATTYGYHRIVTPYEEIIRSKGNVPAAPEAEVFAHNDYAREYMEGAEKNNIKPFVLQIEISELTLNGRSVALKDFAARVDANTKDWEETDYTSVRPNVFIASTPKEFLDKVDIEFRKTNYSKANGGMNIVPPPPAPPSPIIKKGEKSNIPPPPEKNESQFKFNKQRFSAGSATSAIANSPKSKLIKERTITTKRVYNTNLNATEKSQENYSQAYLNGAARNGKKAFVLQIEVSKIKFNGIPVTLNTLTKTMDAYTKDWEETDYTSAHPSILMASTPEEFRDKVDKEFRKSNYSKANGGMSIRREASLLDESIPQPPIPARLTTGNDKLDEIGTANVNGVKYYYRTTNNTTIFYDKWGNTIDAKGKTISDKVIMSTNWEVKKGEASNIPPPPSSTNPLDYIVKMAKEGATFQYENNEISSDKAIELIKAQPQLKVTTRYKDDKPQVVTIEKAESTMNRGTFPKPTKGNVLSHLKVMNRHNNTFYYNNEIITFKEALKIVRKDLRKGYTLDVSSDIEKNETYINDVN